MATINFYLKEPNKVNLCTIHLVYQDKGRKFKYSTKIQTKKECWDGKRIIGKTLDIMEKNKMLNDYEEMILEIEREALRLNKFYSIDVVESKFKLKLAVKSNDSEFFVYMDSFIENSRATKTPNTIKGYISLKNMLKRFARAKKVDISFENINSIFYHKLVSYLILEENLLNNSVGKDIKNLKVFLNYIQDNEVVNQKFNLKAFKTLKEDVDIIALTEEELWKIYEVEGLPDNLEFVKDIFCFECFTGLRFSDVSRLKNENIKGDMMEFRTQKTKESLFVPLNYYAKQILNKYKGKCGERPLPKTLTNQKTNQYIKDIAELAGVTDEMMIEKFSGSRRIVITKPKCDFITTHTGRKTFITLSAERGMQVEMIMKITGIKKWETLKKYMKISEKAKLIKMNQYWDKKSEVVNS